jgi:prevent-host-death family protein
MPWSVLLKPSVVDDLRWFGKTLGRKHLESAEERLSEDPLIESRNMKTLRPNGVAERELRLLGKYRILFNTEQTKKLGKSQSSSLVRSEATRFSFKERSLPPMKVIPLSEAKANLSHYGRSCHDEPIIVTVNGVPLFQLAPLSEDDDLIDSLIAHNPKFRETLKSRLKEKSISLKAARKRL